MPTSECRSKRSYVAENFEHVLVEILAMGHRNAHDLRATTCCTLCRGLVDRKNKITNVVDPKKHLQAWR